MNDDIKKRPLMNNLCPVCNKTLPFPKAVIQHIQDKKDEKHRKYCQNNIPSTHQRKSEKRRLWVFRLSLGDSGEPERVCPLYINRPRLKQEIMRYKKNVSPIDFTSYLQLNMNILKNELFEKGKLRQGWGQEFDGMNLDLTLPEEKWIENYIKLDWRIWGCESDCPIAMGRYNILKSMKEIEVDNIIFIPRIPKENKFSIATVKKEYYFQPLNGFIGHGHVIEVENIKEFIYGINLPKVIFRHYRTAIAEIKEDHLIFPQITNFLNSNYF